MQSRPYQLAAHKSIINGLETGSYRQLIQAATGTGKTVIFSKLPEQLKATHPGKMLVLAHREELIDQAIKKLQKSNHTLRIDKEMAEHKADPEAADVVVASVATLGRAGSKRILGYDWTKFDKFVVDEAHHAVASTYMNIFETAGLMQPGDKRLLLGVTATSQRGDGQALAKLFEKIVFTYPMRQAIEDGWLVDVRGFKVSTNVSLDGVKTSGGEYDQTQLANTVNTPQRNQLIVKSWLDQAQGRQTIGFTVDIKHAVDLAKMFRYHGIKAEAIWGDDPDRAWKLARHKGVDAIRAFIIAEAEGNGTDVAMPSDNTLEDLRITVLLNAALLIEGYDDWRIGCVILAGPTKSPVKFAQEVGRGTRLEELPDGTVRNLNEWKQEYLKAHAAEAAFGKLTFPFKTDCIVIDVVDASNRNTLVTLPTLMGLSAGLNLNGKGLYAVLKEIEEAQKEYPHIDFSKLESIDDLKAHIENVNFFEVKFATEVEQNSELTWYPSPTGGYIMVLPSYETGKMTPYGKPEKASEALSIKQNLLDKWEIRGTIKGRTAKGERGTMAEAFSAADSVVANLYPDALKLLRRKETWHDDPATEGQVKLLKKFYKNKVVPPGLTKGAASRLISSHMAAR